MPHAPWSSRYGTVLILLALVLATLAQGRSTLRWGDGLELVAVSTQLGVAHPPGYPLFTAMLHGATSVHAADPYAAALWVCRLAACGAAFVLALTLRGLMRRRGLPETTSLIASLLFALAFLFGGSSWPTLHVVEVYGFNALLLALLAWLLVHRDPPASGRVLLLAAAVQGLALAHHLTSAAMLPLVVLALIEHQRRGQRSAVLIAVVLILGLPALLYASLLSRAPGPQEETIVWGGMQSAGALLEHLRGREYGAAQFLMADPHTRFELGGWLAFAGKRIVQVVTSAGGVIAGPTAIAPFVGVLMVLLTAMGARELLARSRALGLGLLSAIALQIGFVLTYNIADIADYFLAIHVLAAPLALSGLLVIAARQHRLVRALPALATLLLLLTIPLNAKTARPEGGEITARYQSRLLGSLPENAAVITAESGDLFLLWYTRFAVGGRRDLVVVPGNLLEREWIRSTLPVADPRREAIVFRERGMDLFEPYVADLRTGVIEPLLDHGRVFTTIRNVDVLEALARHYEFRQVTELLRRDEIEQLRSDALPRAPGVLWELRRPPR